MSSITVPFFISHQGCPHSCIFCDQRTISGSNGDLPDREEIIAKVNAWRCSAKGRSLEVAFFGGTFTALPRDTQERLLQPLQPLLAKGEVSSIRISTRPDCIDVETVRWLSRLGVGIIELGVQSMDDSVLKASGRGHDASASWDAIHCIRLCGLLAGAQLMPGLPGDTLATSLDSMQKVISAGAGFVRLYPAVVLRGTELSARYVKGEYSPLSVEAGVAVCKVLLKMALKTGVDVIRIGLQASEEINSESVIAGCWHPAMGQLVRSELYFDLMVQLISGLAGNFPLTVRCHPSRVSDCIGHGRKNLFRLRERGVVLDQIVSDGSLSVQEVVVENRNQVFQGNIITADLY